jgi:AcrR family transcriptional regulator
MAAADPEPNGHTIRSQRSTRAMLEAAGEIIAESGYGAVTFVAVGERSGYSRGLVTARFGSKDKMMRALIDRITDGWNASHVFPRAEGKDGGTGLLIGFEELVEQFRRDTRSLAVLYTLIFEALGPDEALRAKMRDLHRELRHYMAELLSRGIEDGSVRPDISPEPEATAIVAMLRGIGYQWRLDPDRIDPVAAFEHVTDMLRERWRPQRVRCLPPFGLRVCGLPPNVTCLTSHRVSSVTDDT